MRKGLHKKTGPVNLVRLTGSVERLNVPVGVGVEEW
jgi:hypothetical protein